MPKRSGEIYGVLARPTADLEHLASISKMPAQYIEDGVSVSLASVGVGLNPRHGAP
jgi:hypothetical protein